ncbi:hypothetical protein QQ020_34695 [Fulvivirgaceae bacterium BMA12]|uniref:Nucleoside 2-deoxyribosyltransferase n=1 Tax=Agaribacillus aureus TaxID=3051825 RepID=A0ABT8LHI6_9BACT|nr:hypothetical protein [Fulvivirgaceae bacterium BMA12]
MDINIITIVITAITSISVSLTAFILSINLKKKRYDKENSRALLESMRKSLEQKMYVLNDRLVQNEERWRDVNHLLLTKEYLENENLIKENNKTYYSGFLKDNGISENDLNMDNRMVFVLTPFNDRFYNEFMTIKATCEDAGFKCFRGDEKEFKGDIFPEMLRYIAKARIIIANINGRNPNVLYELGVAQAMDKSVILVSKEPKDLPIDIQSQRFLIYSDSDSLRESLKVELEKLI